MRMKKIFPYFPVSTDCDTNIRVSETFVPLVFFAPLKVSLFLFYFIKLSVKTKNIKPI